MFLFDVVAGLFLLAHVGLLAVERSKASPERAQQRQVQTLRMGRQAIAFAALGWVLLVAVWGSAWTKVPRHKLFPLVGFLCVAAIEAFEVLQRQSAWDPVLFARHALGSIGVALVLVYRLSGGPQDWKMYALPLVAALPVLSVLLWPSQATFEAKPVPYPDGAVLVPGTLLAAWLAATMNYGVPSFITGVRGSLFRGATVALLAGTAVFFARLSGAIVAWFARFQSHVRMAPYAAYAVGSMVVVSGLVVALSGQIASPALALVWLPVLLGTALAASVQLHWPSPIPDVQSPAESLQTSLAELNKNSRLVTAPEKALDADFLRLRAVSLEAIPSVVRRNITRFQVPWMLGKTVTTGSYARIGRSMDPWAWIQPRVGAEAEVQSVPRTMERAFLEKGPFAPTLSLRDRPVPADLKNSSMFALLYDGEAGLQTLTFRAALSYGGELETAQHHLGHLVYLARRIQYWRRLIGERAKASEGQLKPADQDFNLPALAGNMPPVANLLTGLVRNGAPLTALPVAFIRGNSQAQLSNLAQTLAPHLPWIEVFEGLPSAFDARANMSINVTGGQSASIDLRPYLVRGRIPENLAVTAEMMRHGPSDGWSLYYMLLYLYCDLHAFAQLHDRFWGGAVPSAEADRAKATRAVDWIAHLLALPSQLENDPAPATQLLQKLPVHAKLLLNVFRWEQDAASGDAYVAETAVPLLFDLVGLSKGPNAIVAIRERILAALAAAAADADLGALHFLLASGGDSELWRSARAWAYQVVDQCAGLSMLLYVASPGPERTRAAPLYPLEGIKDGLQRQVIARYLWDPSFGAAGGRPSDDPRLRAYQEIVPRFRNFGVSSALQAAHGFVWLLGLAVVMGLRLKRDPATSSLLVGLFGNFEGLGHYRRFAYGAVFVLLAAGALPLLTNLRLETLRNRFTAATARESLPYVAFYAVTALYLAPALIHQISRQQLRTLYFLVLFFVFMFFAPLRPFLPLPQKLLDQWSVMGDRFTNRANAVASGVTLFVLVLMVAFGFFERPWPVAAQLLVCAVLIACSIFASPLYVFLRDMKNDPTAPPVEAAELGRSVDDLQRDLNRGIFYSFGSLLVTAVLTWKFFRNSTGTKAVSRKIPKNVHDLQFVDA